MSSAFHQLRGGLTSTQERLKHLCLIGVKYSLHFISCKYLNLMEEMSLSFFKHYHHTILSS